MSVGKFKGFSLIELVVVIMVLSIVSISVVSFVRFGVDIYQDGAGRARQIAESRFLIERMTRELREAVPNSIRVANGCIEFLPIISSSSYIDIPVAPDNAINSVEVVAEHGIILPNPDDPNVNLTFIVYPSDTLDVYSATNKKRADISAISAITNNTRTLTLDSSMVFAQDSPTQRYFIAEKPVSYCQKSGNRVFRYDGYNATTVQSSSPSTGVLMAQYQVQPQPFNYHGPTLIRNAIVQLNFEFRYNDETVKLYNEVHIANVP